MHYIKWSVISSLLTWVWLLLKVCGTLHNLCSVFNIPSVLFHDTSGAPICCALFLAAIRPDDSRVG
jgi:hypothetical protein